MFIHVYGNPEDPKVVLLAPMMVSGEDLYQLMKPYFKGNHFFIAPDQGGHGKAGAYISAEEEYRELKAYLVENDYKKIDLLYGASMGVAVAYRLFMDPDFAVGKAWFDGVALNKDAAVAEVVMRNMFRKRKKMLDKSLVDASPTLVEMYGYDFAKMMTANFERITLSDVDNICYACCHYDLKPLTQSQQSKLHLEYGSGDFDLKISRKAMKTYMPSVTPVIREGYGHCGYMAAHPKEYVEEMERWMNAPSADESRAAHRGSAGTPGQTSVQYKVVKALFSVLGVNKMLDKKGENFDKLLAKYSKLQKKPLKVPFEKMRPEFDVETKLIDGTTCYVVRVSGTKPQRAVLYLFGGGYILPPDPGDIILCGQIARNCDAEVWFPLYPMAPDHKLVETVQNTLKVYQEILNGFPAEQVRFFGTSSGGGLALSLCMYIKHEKMDTPYPGKLVLQSPGLQVPPSESQKAEMEKRIKVDVMIPPGFFDEIAPVLATGDEAYLLSPILFDMTGFPPIDIFYGTREVMIAYLKDMKAACAKCHVPLHIHIGRGMMHCWGAMEFVPEAQAVRQEYFEALR